LRMVGGGVARTGRPVNDLPEWYIFGL